MTARSTSSSPQPKSWIELINESVHTSDDIDIGDIDAISRDFVVVRRGFVKIHYYYIPITKVEGWDGNVLWLQATESEVKASYERDKAADPIQYYVEDYAYYSSLHYPELTTIPLRDIRSVLTTPSPPPNSKVHLIYKCRLCDTPFNTEDEQSKHVTSQH
jgi:hypothetical protein